jgi:hypothetical protein
MRHDGDQRENDEAEHKDFVKLLRFGFGEPAERAFPWW